MIGPRVYIPQWSYDVACFDFSTGASCAGFPKYFNGLGLLYTVNLDPQRPTCIWVNSDNGADQIQNFDAFGGNGCGQGAIRVLASQFVVPNSACYPASYQSLQITDPAASTYDTSGSPNGSNITFEDADGNPIAGVGTQYLDGTGTVNLTGLNLNGPLGLPQFLISLTNPTIPITSVTVTLTWSATYDPSCVPQGGGVTPTATSTSTQLSGGGSSGADISVAQGTAVTDQATLGGTDIAQGGGTVTYSVYSDANCTVSAGAASTVDVTNGSAPASSAVTLNSPGTYYWQATYSGDPGNLSSMSQCGSEIETVTGSGPSPEPTSVDTQLTGGGNTNWSIIVPDGSSVTDQATLSGANIATAGGTVTYQVYSDSICSVPAAAADTVSVTDGVVPASAVVSLPTGNYYWTVTYSGDASNDPSADSCFEHEVVLSGARFGADVGVGLAIQPASPPVGSQFVICVTVANYGPKAAGHVFAGVLLPAGVTVVNPAGATQIGRLLYWKIGSMTVGETITYEVWVSDASPGSVKISDGALSLSTIDPNYHNNFASESVTVNGPRVSARRVRASSGPFLARLRVLGRALAHGSR